MTDTKKIIHYNYTDKRTLWTIRWNKKTSVFSWRLDPDYWRWLESLSEHEQKLFRHMHFLDVSAKIREILDTGDYNSGYKE